VAGIVGKARQQAAATGIAQRIASAATSVTTSGVIHQHLFAGPHSPLLRQIPYPSHLSPFKNRANFSKQVDFLRHFALIP
jgi:hypothetical protein